MEKIATLFRGIRAEMAGGLLRSTRRMISDALFTGNEHAGANAWLLLFPQGMCGMTQRSAPKVNRVMVDASPEPENSL
jgi:hypothetical protein